MSTSSPQRTGSDTGAPRPQQPRPGLRLVPAPESTDDETRTRRVLSSVENGAGIFSLMLFVGSAIALRESVLRDDSLLFPAGCGLFVLSVLLPVATRSRS